MDISIDNIVSIITGVVTIASVIVRFTPTPADDSVMAKVRPVLTMLALNKPEIFNDKEKEN